MFGRIRHAIDVLSRHEPPYSEENPVRGILQPRTGIITDISLLPVVCLDEYRIPISMLRDWLQREIKERGNA